MITITEFVDQVDQIYKTAAEFSYIHPTLYLLISEPEFKNLDPARREELFLQKVDLGPDDLHWIRSTGLLELHLITEEERKTEYEFFDVGGHGHHWIEWLGPLRRRQEATASRRLAAEGGQTGPRAVHFYGYKGGQARSTLLTLLAKHLADAGQRVLVVDGDIEAPSLDTMLGVAIELPQQTLMGLCGWAKDIQPVARAYVGGHAGGNVDVIGCRPRTPQFDLDFAVFALKTSFDARLLESAAIRLRNFCKEKYDVVLFDHRTGVTSSVLPIVYGWPGPAAIFVRPDSTTRISEVKDVLRALLSQDAETAGAFVSFSLDPEETIEKAEHNHGKFVDELLGLLSDGITFGSELDDIDPLELRDSWVFWHHDRAMLSSPSPNPKDLSAVNLRAINQLADVLDLATRTTPELRPSLPKLSRSGATDDGWFILTPDIARVFSVESSILYIFGRKGTGKTRLVRELDSQGLGEPLLVASDYAEGGLQSNSSLFTTLIQKCGNNFDTFWWSLLRFGLECDSTKSSHFLTQILDTCNSTSTKVFTSRVKPVEVERMAAKAPARRVFLIDGVETAVPAAELRSFVESLFRFMSTLQYNRALASRLTVRLFLRSDLARGASQNVEQQTEGSELNLRWDKSSILNFALGRLASLPWFKSEFSDVCAQIERERALIARGALSEDDAEKFLLRVFPKSLERNKLKTTTFFSTYFSDAGGDSEDRASFYPRLFDGFLRNINDKARAETTTKAIIEDRRLKSVFVLQAYDEASGRFIDEVRTELYALLDFSPEVSANHQAVDSMIDAFSGQKTPFLLDELSGILASKTKLKKGAVREALRAMKAMGIFEDRPGYPDYWRTGRLYKAGLRMKYVR